MNISEQGVKLLIELEACKLLPYSDATGKIITEWSKFATIGCGHLILQHEWDRYKKGITKSQAEDLLKTDLIRFENNISKLSWLEQWEFDSLVIFSFNIGIASFNTSTAKRMLENKEFISKDYKSLEDAWKAWNKDDGQVSKGLVARRDREWKLYTSGTYSK